MYSQTDGVTIEQFVLEHFSPEQRSEVARPLIDRFVAVFNALRVHVFQRGRGGAAAQRSLGDASQGFDSIEFQLKIFNRVLGRDSTKW